MSISLEQWIASQACATERATCRVCGAADLLEVLSLGELCVSNFIPPPSRGASDLAGTTFPTPIRDREEGAWYAEKAGGFLDGESTHAGVVAPLDLMLCAREHGGCGLVQLRHTVERDLLYRTYWYRSGTNASMRGELAAIAARAEEIVGLERGDVVLDIGANDGTLLRSYRARDIVRAGFEPAANLRSAAAVGGQTVISDYFSAQEFFTYFPAQRAKIVTAIAMFYDLDDPNAFVADLARVLAPDGLAIIQMSYLPLMLEKNAFDNICHEHLEYYALGSLEFLLRRHGLEVFDVELNDVNGGSFRVYIRHHGARSPRPAGGFERVASLRRREAALALETSAPYEAFARRVAQIRADLVSFLEREVGAGKQIYVYGASTKGNTLLQYFGLDTRLITAAAERNPLKWGLRTVRTNIPIISEVEARAGRPEYFLALPWHFMSEFLERERAFLERGGKFIVPLPEFRVIGGENVMFAPSDSSASAGLYSAAAHPLKA